MRCPVLCRMLFFIPRIPMLTSFKQLLFTDSPDKPKFNFLTQVGAGRGSTVNAGFFLPSRFQVRRA